MGLGVFDGVHVGHQTIVAQSDAILTFMPHPDRVLVKTPHLRYLTTLREQRALVPRLLGVHFTKRMAAWSYTVFLDNIRNALPVAKLVIGEDFFCGAKKQGTPEAIAEWGLSRNVAVQRVPLHTYHGMPVKSATIRDTIQAGQLKDAVAMLGHPYPISGVVIAGAGVGKTLGFPTANLRVSRYKLLPPFGVYAGYVIRAGRKCRAVLYIGKRPTFGGQHVSVEVHLIGMPITESLYGEYLSVQVTDRIRGEMTFADRAALVAQIGQDIDVALDHSYG